MKKYPSTAAFEITGQHTPGELTDAQRYVENSSLNEDEEAFLHNHLRTVVQAGLMFNRKGRKSVSDGTILFRTIVVT
jgi:hypothetical protein